MKAASSKFVTEPTVLVSGSTVDISSLVAKAKAGSVFCGCRPSRGGHRGRGEHLVSPLANLLGILSIAVHFLFPIRGGDNPHGGRPSSGEIS